MKIMTTLDTAVNALSANVGRTVLTSLGITIGIAAVIAMVSAGNGARQKLDSALGDIGPNLVVARSGQTTRSGLLVGASDGAFTREDAKALRRQLKPYVTGVAEVHQYPCEVQSEVGSYYSVLNGGVPEVFRIRRWQKKFGRFYNDEDEKRQSNVAVLGKTVADKLFPNVNPVGRMIRAAGLQFEVIGLLEPKGTNLIGADQDDIIMIPMNTLLRKVMNIDRVKLIVAEARSSELIEPVRIRMDRILRERHKVRSGDEAEFRVNSIREMASLADTFTNTLSVLVFAIASVSLVVGGIGVMNIMMVSVTERTREIGIRIAIGAKTRDVLGQFLTESVILALIGGGVGIALGAGVAWLIAFVAGWDCLISPTSVIVAVFTSAAVGVFFGYYPARKASLLDPIEALRYE